MKVSDQDHDKHVTTPEFSELTSENYVARLKQANLASKNDIVNFVNKTDLDDKLISLIKVNSNKTTHVLVEIELNELSKKLKQYQQKN